MVFKNSLPKGSNKGLKVYMEKSLNRHQFIQTVKNILLKMCFVVSLELIPKGAIKRANLRAPTS